MLALVGFTSIGLEMFIVFSPPTYKPERRYIIELLLNDFLGLPCAIKFQNRRDIVIQGEDKKEIHLADVFFQTPKKIWLTPKSMPKEPLPGLDPHITTNRNNHGFSKLPVIFGQTERRPTKANSIPIDIFGSSFFMLSRYEEYFQVVEDFHKRFPASASIAYRNDFLDRPIINEYLEILWSCLKKQWPGLRRKQRTFRLIPTHDVDIPYEYLGQPFRKIVIKSAADAYHGLKFRQIFDNISNWIKINGGGGQDPYDTHNWLMAIAEKENLKATFNFMSGGRLPVDYYYSLKGKHIKRLIKRITRRGHEIGFHPSYLTAFDGELWKTEFDKFQKVLNGYPIKGGRQHFLIFKIPYTWRYWSENSLEYDSTLGFADHAGFRCGICYEYPVFDLEKRRQMSLRERPLIAMERTVIDDAYQGLGTTPAALDYMQKLKYNCRKFRGDFVLLWHNQRFVDHKEREIYRALIGTN